MHEALVTVRMEDHIHQRENEIGASTTAPLPLMLFLEEVLDQVAASDALELGNDRKFFLVDLPGRIEVELGEIISDRIRFIRRDRPNRYA